ncbi:MAG: hypothetical protein Q7K98_04040 [Candidatus Omnitrophota bacterium]|nr:hypothetical protein [Candidatus Omnitrophota bacterium]
MKRVVIAKNIDKNTLKMIRDHLPGGNDERIYLVFGNPDIHNLHSLEALGFKEQCLPAHDEQYRDNFLREYIDLIGSIGKENNILEWWATDIASKNRFTSRITELLSHFLDIVQTAKDKPFGIMVVVNPDWAIVSSLKKACLKDGIGFIAGNGFAVEKIFSFTALRLRSLASVIRNFGKIGIRSIYCRFILGKKTQSSVKDSGPYYVVKTFIYNSSFSEGHDYKDSFFGKLPYILSKNRKVLIFASVLGSYRYCLQEIKKCNSFRIIPVEYFITFLDLISAFKAFILSRVVISDKYMLSCEVAGIIRNELERTWNGIQYYQLFHYWALKRLLSGVRVDTFLLTYENNPWEKMCIAALRQISPDTFIIGYQHTIVSQASANMFPSRYENGIMPFPDKIVTVGEATKNIMQRYGNFGDVSIRASCGLRFEYLFDLGRLERKNNGNILLALEGIKDAHKLVAYVLRELGGKSKYNVRIRTHPALPWQYFQSRCRFDLAKYSNFHLSPGGLVRADMEWADTVIYWGSTIAVEALNLGRPVVHYNTGSILNYDPLFESSDFKWVVNENVSLTVILEKINSLDDQEFTSGWKKAKTYLDDYFHPITEENMKEFIKDASSIGAK